MLIWKHRAIVGIEMLTILTSSAPMNAARESVKTIKTSFFRTDAWALIISTYAEIEKSAKRPGFTRHEDAIVYARHGRELICLCVSERRQVG